VVFAPAGYYLLIVNEVIGLMPYDFSIDSILMLLKPFLSGGFTILLLNIPAQVWVVTL
jgi:hypothetical protein